MTREELQAALDEAIRNLAVEQSQLAAAQSAVIKETQDVANAQAAVDAAQEALDNYQEPDVTREELEAALAAAKESLIAAQTALAEAQGDVTRINGDIINLRNEIQELEDRVAALNITLSDSEAALVEAQAKVTSANIVVGDAEVAVQQAQAALDAYEPEPEPAELEPYPVFIEGQQVSFRTEPPENVTVRQHPRFLIPGKEDEIRAKLTDPKWSFEVGRIGGALRWALEYALNGNTELGIKAKDAMLTLDGEQNRSGSDWYIHWLLVYDWCHDLFTQEEKELAFDHMCGEAGLSTPTPGSIEFTIEGVPRHTEKGNGAIGLYHNDPHEPYSHANGFQFRGLIGIAFHGDGVRDEWCDYVLQRMLDQTDGRIYGIYDPVRGGTLDCHNSLALNSGGCQAGDHGELTPITGYNSMFFNSCSRLWAMCESALGLELFKYDNFYRKAPHWILYRGGSVGSGEALQVFSMLTGIYKEIDPETAGLAAYIGQQHGTGKYYEMFALCLGDRSITPLSPAEAGLAETSVRDGDDFWVSRDKWPPELHTEVELTFRSLDLNRYENDCGLLRVTHHGEKMVHSGQAKKGNRSVKFGSGIWIWRGEVAPARLQGDTYWHNFHLRGLGDPSLVVKRANWPYEAATKRGYRGSSPTESFGSKEYGFCTVDSAKFAVHETRNLQVIKNKRTVVHLKPNANGREFVVCYDRVVLGDDDQLRHCWGIRLENQPVVNGNKFSMVNNLKALHGTVLTPGTIDVRGGQYAPKSVWDEMTANIASLEKQIQAAKDSGEAAYADQLIAQKNALLDERWTLFRITEGPNGESYHGSGYIFTDVADGRGEFGDFSLYIKPGTGFVQAAEYCVVFEIGNTGFTPVPASFVNKIVSVDGWQIDFSIEDQTKVFH